MHVPQLSAVCKQLHCDIMEVPANAFTVRVLLVLKPHNPCLTRPFQSPYHLMPDVSYTFHTPHPPEGQLKAVGLLRVDLDLEKVALETYHGDSFDHAVTENLDFMAWESKIRAKGIVLTPLIQRAGAAVVIVETNPETREETRQIGCLVPPHENDGSLFDPSDLTYHALLTSNMNTARVFFMDILSECLLPVGEVLYLNMAVLDDARFRELGRGGKVLYTRLDVPHVRVPEVGKLYVTCLHQPRGSNRRTARSATAITLAVNPWDVQLASVYSGDPANVVKHLH